MTFEDILHEFNAILDINGWTPENSIQKEFSSVVNSIGEPSIVDNNQISSCLCYVVSDKLDIYANQIKAFIDNVAKQAIYFNYLEKLAIRGYFISSDISALSSLLENKKAENRNTILEQIALRTDFEIIQMMKEVIRSDKKYIEVLNSVFSALIFKLFDKDKILSYYSCSNYKDKRFYSFLKSRYPKKYDREHALSIIYIDENYFFQAESYEQALASICGKLLNEYVDLQNYCYSAIIIDDIRIGNESITWRLYSDIVLYATKSIEEKLKIGYFHPDRISQITNAYIHNVDNDEADFSIANAGFTYKDCFILNSESMCAEGSEIYSPYRLLILLQKNQRDEEIIPCPDCLSINVRGNSYPVLGVKSWECNNPLCPDKSKYNRGKRYSMSSIIKQEAIEDIKSYIPKDYLSDWRLDVVSGKGLYSTIDYIVRVYSFYGDKIYLYNVGDFGHIISGRELCYGALVYTKDNSSLDFFESAYFKRFLIDDNSEAQGHYINISGRDNTVIMNGNCRDVLKGFPQNYFDGAITSPPYYNAKEYSHWQNIYCYLYDMYNQAREVYRTLKPGGYFVYNIFDYFDNENNIVFSAMGEGRMILGAYIIYLFRKIGFIIQDNTIWYKGQIQGHRSTNQGNNSPYYQAPLNCYEHIFCFRKPGNEQSFIDFPKIVNVHPVVKMKKGVNTLGHTAPYPIGIARLLTSRVKGTILDPYSGSFTTARAAIADNIKSVNIEMSKDYCELGMTLLGFRGNSLF